MENISNYKQKLENLQERYRILKETIEKEGRSPVTETWEKIQNDTITYFNPN